MDQKRKKRRRNEEGGTGEQALAPKELAPPPPHRHRRHPASIQQHHSATQQPAAAHTTPRRPHARERRGPNSGSTHMSTKGGAGAMAPGSSHRQDNIEQTDRDRDGSRYSTKRWVEGNDEGRDLKNQGADEQRRCWRRALSRCRWSLVLTDKSQSLSPSV